MEICFASNNEGKRKEIAALTENQLTILNLKDIGCFEELPENQDTLEGNSIEKAEYVWKNYGISCFADDSGLEVEALDGAPGVYSAMYAGPGRIASDNIDLLLSRLQGKKNRSATFRTIITLILNGNYHQFEGSVSGTIALERSGSGGFGYDPVFIPEGYGQSFAMLGLDEKNKISHRGIAVKKLADFLLAKHHG